MAFEEEFYIGVVKNVNGTMISTEFMEKTRGNRYKWPTRSTIEVHDQHFVLNVVPCLVPADNSGRGFVLENVAPINVDYRKYQARYFE